MAAFFIISAVPKVMHQVPDVLW